MQIAEPRIDENTTIKEIDIPEKILEYLKQKNGIKRKFDDKKYSVTELIKCVRETYYKKTKVKFEESFDKSVQSMWGSLRGNYLHELTNAYTWNELETEYNVPLDGDNSATLVGRLDMYDETTKTLLDLKTTNNVLWQVKHDMLPKHEHILQVQCYYTMFKEIIPIEHLNLIYADMSEIVVFDLQVKDRSKWIRNRINILETDLENGITPNAESGNNCKFCKFKSTCDLQNIKSDGDRT